MFVKRSIINCYPLKPTHSYLSPFAIFFYDVMGHGINSTLVKSLFRKTLGDMADDPMLEDLPATSEVMNKMNRAFFSIPEALPFFISSQ
ncbi:MAG: hypothetical protein AB1756_00825 [Acidobacteriota bacterium]